jgi:hypothetical protein
MDPAIYHYEMFRSRCKRIPKNDIAKAHAEFQLEMGSIHWADDKQRVAGLAEMIDLVTNKIKSGAFDKDTTGTLATLVRSLQGIYEQVRKEVQGDADRAALSASGTKVLLQNPHNVQIDASYISELVLLYRSEVGGLHTLDFTPLTTKELTLLSERVQSVLADRITRMEETKSILDDRETE